MQKGCQDVPNTICCVDCHQDAERGQNDLLVIDVGEDEFHVCCGSGTRVLMAHGEHAQMRPVSMAPRILERTR